MHPFIRTFTLALLSGALLVPAHGSAVQNEPCFVPPESSGMIGDTRTVISGNATFASASAGISDARLRLDVTIAPDGSGEVHGEIQLHAEPTAGEQPTRGAVEPTVFVVRDVVQAVCADTDGDGTAGLVRLQVEIRPESQRGRQIFQRKFTRIVGGPLFDIDASGSYAVEVQIGDETGSGEVRVRLSQDRSGR